MPADCCEPAEQRLASLFLIEMKPLRIVFGGELLDRLCSEGVGADLAALADFQVFVDSSSRLLRRA